MYWYIELVFWVWYVVWVSNFYYSLECFNFFGLGFFFVDVIIMFDLVYVCFFVNLLWFKEKFWQWDWDGMVEELVRGLEIIQYVEYFLVFNIDLVVMEQLDVFGVSLYFVDFLLM